MEHILGQLRRLFKDKTEANVYMSLDSHHWEGMQVVSQPEGEYVKVIGKDQNA
jgi:hypothetical protein